MKLDELTAGTAGEHLVCADLLLHGYAVYLATQACAYDVVADCAGRLIKIQVKATMSPRPFLQRGQSHITGYTWSPRQGKGARRAYLESAFDVLALVALDTKQIAYVPKSLVRQTLQIPVTGARSAGVKTFAALSLEKALGSL